MSLTFDLPFDHRFRYMAGIHLVKDGGLFSNDTYLIEPEKVELDVWSETEETVHECSNISEDCKRCANNDKILIEFMTIRSKFKPSMSFTFRREIQDRIGACWSEWTMIT